MMFVMLWRTQSLRTFYFGVLLSLFGFGQGPLAWALDGRKLISQYVTHDWSTEHGLPDNNIQEVVQSADGYLWLGTQKSGLVRFDGARFEPWPADWGDSGDGVSIRALCETGDGSLWAGTDGSGLFRFQGKQRTRYGKGDGLPDDHIRVLHEDRAGVLWIGLNGRALAQRKSNQFVVVPLPEDGPAAVVDFFEDREGGMWLAGDGLWYFKDGQFTNLQKKWGLRPLRFTSVRESRDGSIWVGTMRGLLRLQGGDVRTYLEVDGLSDEQVRTLHLDREGNLWIGTNSGLDRFRDGKFTRCLTKDHAPYDLVYTIFEDREGSLWIGTNGGLTRLRDDKFSNLTTRDGLPQNLIAAAVEAPDGSLWLASRTRGIARAKDGETTIYDKQKGLARDSMRCIHADGHGTIWAGTQNGGLTCIDNGAVSTLGMEGELNGRLVNAIQDDPEGHLWLLVEEGALFRFVNGAFRRLAAEEGLVGRKVEAIHSGMGGGFWAVTEAGLNLRQGSQWRNFGLPEGLKGKPVRSLYEDRDGMVWLCFASGGLVRFADGKFTRYRAAQGLFDHSPYSVLEDSQNNLWMSSGKGVFRVRKSDFSRLDRGEIKKLDCVSFSEAEGMSSRRCSRVGFPLATKLGDGRLCFPTDRGLAIVDPENLPQNPVVPPVLIESIFVDHHRFQPDRIERLGSKTKDIEIQYSAISLRGADKVVFKYRLEGYDEDWIDAKTRRVAHYQNLAPGRYRFRVIAANEDGIWNKEGAAFAFTKEPLLYQTAGFYVLCGSLIAAAVGLIFWSRFARAKRHFAAQLEERTRIARDLHDTLEQGLVGISMQLNLAAARLSRSQGVGQKHLEKARYMLRLTMADARSAISNLRNGSSKPKDLMSEFARIADELALGSSLRLRTHEQGDPVKLTPFAEDTLIRIAQEAMTNVLKHARATTVQLELTNEPDRLTLRIRDDGCGFDVAPTVGGSERGYGLLGMRERTEKLGGALTISSAPSQGTLIEVVLPRTRR